MHWQMREHWQKVIGDTPARTASVHSSEADGALAAFGLHYRLAGKQGHESFG